MLVTGILFNIAVGAFYLWWLLAAADKNIKGSTGTRILYFLT